MSDANSRDESVFTGALQLPPDQRAGYLQAACGEDTEMRRRVEALLKAHQQETGPLEEPTVPDGATIVLSLPSGEKPGDTIGNYKILQQIGEGGCGSVYMADQERPVRRRVAFKVIKLGMDTRQVIARFEAERQALALMDHPNIAKVLDAGATETGRPYFVMELVRGIKITDYCDQNNLSTEKRLELFAQVCRAIQHAHQKGIIHRDIKPSNILVTLHDGVPVPKVIDFGIAKATDQKLTDKTLFTQFEQFIGTPAYMSPEQAEMSGLDIDTRSDIYSLGVLLYELLTSRTPFDPKELMAQGLDAMRRMIREKEPPRPSTRLSTLLDADLTTVARQRHSVPPKLIHLVSGDLDWIVMKALEKDRTRRYDTANSLAADVQAYLQDEAIIARPPSQLYRFRKMVQRNKLAFAAASAVAASLVIGLGFSTWLFLKEKQARHLADREARHSQQVALFLEEMLQGVGPSVALGRDTALLKDILDKTVERVTKDLRDQPEVQAELCNTIGEVYRALGQLDKAERMHRSARSLQGDSARRVQPDIEKSLADLAFVLRDQGKFTEAEALQSEVLALRRQRVGNEHPDVALSLNNLGLVLRSEGRLVEAESLHRQALAMQRKLLGDRHLAVAMSLNNLGLALRDEGRLAEAETDVRLGLAIQKQNVGNEHPGVALALDNLAFILREEGRFAEAEVLERQALAMQKRFLGEQHKDVATAMNNLALILERQGAVSEAEALHREALAMRRKLLGSEHLEVASSLDNLALLLRLPSRFDEAESLARQALAIRRRALGQEHIAVAGSLNNLGLVLRDRGKLSEAETTFRDSLAIEQKTLTVEHPSFAITLYHLADVLLREHKAGDADALINEYLTPARAGKPEGAALLCTRGAIHARTGRCAEAIADYSKAIELEPNHHEAYDSLAVLLAQTGNTEAYRRHCARLLALFGATQEPFLAGRIAKDCLILPASGADLESVQKLADIAVTAEKACRTHHAFALIKGLVDHREGRFAAAIDRLQTLLAAPAGNGICAVEASLVLAMAQQMAKQTAGARTSLARGVDLAKLKMPARDADDLGLDWSDVLVARTLLREASALIDPSLKSASVAHDP